MAETQAALVALLKRAEDHVDELILAMFDEVEVERGRLREALESLKEAVVTWHSVNFNLRDGDHTSICAICQATFDAQDVLDSRPAAKDDE